MKNMLKYTTPVLLSLACLGLLAIATYTTTRDATNSLGVSSTSQVSSSSSSETTSESSSESPLWDTQVFRYTGQSTSGVDYRLRYTEASRNEKQKEVDGYIYSYIYTNFNSSTQQYEDRYFASISTPVKGVSEWLSIPIDENGNEI